MADEKPIPTGQQVRVMLWTVPRSISTVLVKCLSFVDDSLVFFEPYLAAHVLGPDKIPWKLPGKSGGVLGRARKSAPTAAGAAGFDASECTYEWVKEQLEDAHTGKKFILCKDMAFGTRNDPKVLPRGYRHVFLVRHPLKVFLSWKKMIQFVVNMPLEEYRLGDLPLTLFPEGFGFKELSDLLDHVKEAHDQEAIIVDADDLLQDPKGILSALSKAIELSFDEKLLKWEAGDAISKQWVMCKTLLDVNQRGHYYRNALDSTCFLKPGSLPDRSTVSEDILQCVDASMPYYEKMYAQRLTA